MLWERVADRSVRYGGKIIGPVLILGSHVLILGALYIYLAHMLPLAYSGRLVRLIHGLLMTWLAITGLFNYAMCVRTSPGLCTDADLEGLWSRSTDRLCTKCQANKPMGAHHCSICGVCVYRMDHHCIWMNNCIGFRNHRFFVLFLIYLWVGCVMVEWGAVKIGWSVWRGWVVVPLERAPLVLGVTILAFAIMCSVGGLLGFQLYLVAHGATNVDYVQTTGLQRARWARLLDFFMPNRAPLHMNLLPVPIVPQLGTYCPI